MLSFKKDKTPTVHELAQRHSAMGMAQKMQGLSAADVGADRTSVMEKRSGYEESTLRSNVQHTIDPCCPGSCGCSCCGARRSQGPGAEGNGVRKCTLCTACGSADCGVRA